MRLLAVAVKVAGLLKLASAAACPFGQAAEAGLLTKNDLAKYNSLKQDQLAEGSLSELHKKAINPAADQGPDKRGLLPGLTLPGLSLPFGGGLCKYSVTKLINVSNIDQRQ